LKYLFFYYMKDSKIDIGVKVTKIFNDSKRPDEGVIGLEDIKLSGKSGVFKSKWTEDRPEQVYRLALLGATEEEMAKIIGVSYSTIQMWKKDKKEFREALQMGKMEADSNVAEALYKRAVGFEKEIEQVVKTKYGVEVVKVKKYFPPDSWAAMKWLSMRQRGRWTDVQRTEITEKRLSVTNIDFSKMTTEELKMLKRIGLKQLEEHVDPN